MSKPKIDYYNLFKLNVDTRIKNFNYEPNDNGYYKIMADILEEMKEDEISDFNDFLSSFTEKDSYVRACAIVKGMRQCGMFRGHASHDNILYWCFNSTSVLEDFLHDDIIHPRKAGVKRA